MTVDFKRLSEPAGPLKGDSCEVTGALLDELKNLSPGQVLRLQGRNGQEIAMMDYGDFMHLCERAGMTTRSTREQTAKD